MNTRRLFVAGSTGATGKVLVRIAREKKIDLVAQARPKSSSPSPATATLVDLTDPKALLAAMKGCTTVVQLIGTMRKRFASGDTYESSDIGTTQALVDAAKKAGVEHMVLLSSVGAGRPVGAYLKAKARAEAIVTESGLDWTIFRPSVLEGNERGSAAGMKLLTRLLHLRKYEPIGLDDLARGMLRAAMLKSPVGVALEGGPLWDVVRAAK